MPSAEEWIISAKEKSAINELQKRIKSDVDETIYKDIFLLNRFLTARDYDVQEAEVMLKKMIEWRKRIGADRILEEYKWTEVLKNYVGKTGIGFDRNGRMLHYVPVGKMDSKGIIMSSKYEDLEKTMTYILEEDEKNLIKKRKEHGAPYPGAFHIYDMDGLTFANATDKKGVENFIKLLKVFQEYYPGRLEAIYVINISSYFKIPLSIAKSCLSSSFVKNAQFYTSSDNWKEKLLEVIDEDQLPAFLGGKRTDPDGNPLCKTIVLQGGKIDEKYYIHKSRNPLSSCPGVKKIVLARASFSELEVEVGRDGSLIEWEFETKTRDIGFGLFYKEILDGEEKITELVPLLRINTEDYSETGVYRCEKAGTYIVLFDNSYSWIRSKEIHYRINTISPEEHEAQLKA